MTYKERVPVADYGERTFFKLYDKNGVERKVYRHFHIAIGKSLDNHLEQDKKLKTYALFKTAFKFEPYLDVFPDFSIRSDFAKLRLSKCT